MGRDGPSIALIAAMICISVTIALIATSPPPQDETPSPEPGTPVEVLEVIDGDTIVVEYPSGRNETIRFAGIDTPEVTSEPSAKNWQYVESSDCLFNTGQEATTYVEREIRTADSVHIRLSEKGDRRGTFGRLIAFVIVDGDNLNYELIDNGLARVYDSEFDRRSEFYAAEDAARGNRTGVWSC